MDLASSVKNGISAGQLQLWQTLCRLWSDHVMWTRSLIVCMAFDLPDQIDVTRKLLRNPADFADVLRSYYSSSAATGFQRFLTNHLSIAGQLVSAQKLENSRAARELCTKWNENSDAFAQFLRSINPFWSETEWREYLYGLRTATLGAAGDILTGRYESSIGKHQLVQAAALKMADCMARGIISQFK